MRQLAHKSNMKVTTSLKIGQVDNSLLACLLACYVLQCHDNNDILTNN